jgi:hypothetical protein
MGRFKAWALGGSLLLILAVAGCGGSGSTTKTSAAVTAASNAPQPAAPAPVRHLSILSPRVGAHTGATITVRVALSGAAASAADRFRYVLDHRFTRTGSDRLTLHELLPGRHRVEVIWTGGGASRAATTFIVRAPAPVALPAPAQTQPSVPTPAPQPTSTTPPPATTAPPKTTTSPPPEASPPPSAGGIPQGPNAGDGDSDNRGGPSDGDGNI